MTKQIPSPNSFDNNEPGLRVGGQVIPLKDIDTAGANNGDAIVFSAADGEFETSASFGTALTSAHILVGDGGGLAQDVAMTGDVSIDNAGATTVNSINGVVVDTTATDTNILVANGTQFNSVTMSGDVAIDNAGSTTVGAVNNSPFVLTSIVKGDIIYFDGSNWINLPIGTTGKVLTVSAGGIPSWA